MENLIIHLSQNFSNGILGDAQILLDQSIIIKLEKLQEIKTLIMNYQNLKSNDIIHLYYSRYLQTLLAEDTPLPDVFNYGIILLADLKKCIGDYDFEICIQILIKKIENSIKIFSTIGSILKLVKTVKRVISIFSDDNLKLIENVIYLVLKAWIVEKKEDFDVWILWEFYKNIDEISTENSIKQNIRDLVAVKAYNWFQKRYMINYINYENFLNTSDDDEKIIYNWIASIDSRSDIKTKIQNFEPLIGKTYAYERDPNSIYKVTENSQLEDIENERVYISSIKKDVYHLAVYKARIRETGEIVVVKSFTAEKSKYLQNGDNERIIYEKLSGVNTDFTLKYYGHIAPKKTINSGSKYELNLVIECCDSTLCDEIINLYNENLTYQNHQLAQHIYTLIDLFKKLRASKVNHCDIKPQNIFITMEKRFKIGDFDLSETFNTIEQSDLGTRFHVWQGGGTECYLAPELKEENKKGKIARNEEIKCSKERSDVYSLGLVFLLMATLKPIGGLNEVDKVNQLNQMIDNLEMGWEKRLLRKMLAFNYQDRPRFGEALEMLEEDPEFILCLNSSR